MQTGAQQHYGFHNKAEQQLSFALTEQRQKKTIQSHEKDLE